MEHKIINLINIKVKNDKIEIESIYKHSKNEKPSIIIDGDILEVKYKEVNFSNEYDITKINVFVNCIKKNSIRFKIKENDDILDTIILDNKDEEIFCEGNEYVIFLSKYKIQILKNQIEIKNKNKFDKIIYEIKKQLYAIKKYNKLFIIRLFAKKKKKYYLFNDRIMYADDNAEQLFKYINDNDRKMARYSYFILDKKSPKLREIKKYGKVLVYGTLKHKIKYLNCKMVISSHASYFDRVYNPFNEQEMELIRDLITKKFVFLQHGVIVKDVHQILNRPQILADLFITTTNPEYEEVSSSKYMYDKEMVVCTGIARLDRLENLNKKVILIAPTWRPHLTDVKYGDDNKENFIESEFYTEYKGLLEDKRIIDKLKKYNFRIKFLLHPVFIKFKKEFDNLNSQNIEILAIDNISYSKLFKECSIFITDYSGTHFDVAYLKKPLIYFHFDKEKFYKSYGKGYFNYETDGFGDVAYKKEELINELINYIEKGCNIKEEYNNRINKTFKYIDKNNSKRIYEEIIKLDKKEEYDYRFNKVH